MAQDRRARPARIGPAVMQMCLDRAREKKRGREGRGGLPGEEAGLPFGGREPQEGGRDWGAGVPLCICIS